MEKITSKYWQTMDEDVQETVDFVDLCETVSEFQTPAREIASFLLTAMTRRRQAFIEQEGHIEPSRIRANNKDLELIRAFQERAIQRDRKRERLTAEYQAEERGSPYEQE